MHIIQYNPEYHDALVGLLEQFFTNSLNDYGVELDLSMIETLETELQETSFLLMDGDQAVGIIAGKLVPEPVSQKVMYQEIIWYVDEKHRSGGVRLLKHLEKWCVEQGISSIIMVRMHNSMPDQLDGFYKRCGYQPMETQYIKGL